jgi:hypothetical protein
MYVGVNIPQNQFLARRHAGQAAVVPVLGEDPAAGDFGHVRLKGAQVRQKFIGPE